MTLTSAPHAAVFGRSAECVSPRDGRHRGELVRRARLNRATFHVGERVLGHQSLSESGSAWTAIASSGLMLSRKRSEREHPRFRASRSKSVLWVRGTRTQMSVDQSAGDFCVMKYGDGNACSVGQSAESTDGHGTRLPFRARRTNADSCSVPWCFSCHVGHGIASCGQRVLSGVRTPDG